MERLSRNTLRSYVATLRILVRDDLQRGVGLRPAPRRQGRAGSCWPRETHLWTFVRVEGIEPTNNEAERSLRHAVLYRKTSGGTDSESGSRFVERILTVVGDMPPAEDKRAGIPHSVLPSSSGRSTRTLPASSRLSRRAGCLIGFELLPNTTTLAFNPSTSNDS